MCGDLKFKAYGYVKTWVTAFMINQLTIIMGPLKPVATIDTPTTTVFLLQPFVPEVLLSEGQQQQQQHVSSMPYQQHQQSQMQNEETNAGSGNYYGSTQTSHGQGADNEQNMCYDNFAHTESRNPHDANYH